MRWNRVVFIGAILLLLCVAITALYIVLTVPDENKLPPLKRGDIVFQTSGSGQSLAIMVASASFYSHVGIIDIRGDDRIFVIEAVGPVKETPLYEWIERGRLKRLAVMRHRSASESENIEIVRNARTYFGRPYDPFFRDDAERIYCSELIYLAYKDAQKNVGRIQKFDDLWLDNPAVKSVFAKRAARHPDCKGMSATACWSAIHDQEVVTPQSIAADRQFHTVYNNYPFIIR